MYNISIKMNTSKDVQVVAHEIAQLIEQTTGERCRISVQNNRIEQNYRKVQNEKIVEKLQNQSS